MKARRAGSDGAEHYIVPRRRGAPGRAAPLPWAQALEASASACRLRFVGGEIPLTTLDVRTAGARALQADLDLPPCAVELRVGRGERQAVLGANLRDHLTVGDVHVLHAGWEEGFAAAGQGHLRKLAALVEPLAR